MGRETGTGTIISKDPASGSPRTNDEQPQKEPSADDFNASIETCEGATAAVFRECNAVCSDRGCNPIFAKGISEGTEVHWPSNCAYLRGNQDHNIEIISTLDGSSWTGGNETLRLLSGCDCNCSAIGTACEAAIAIALRVYAQAQAMESPGCFSTIVYPQFHGDTMYDEGVRGGAKTLPSSALATMLFSARGVRWIPV